MSRTVARAYGVALFLLLLVPCGLWAQARVTGADVTGRSATNRVG
jgi:hypothetical protein